MTISEMEAEIATLKVKVDMQSQMLANIKTLLYPLFNALDMTGRTPEGYRLEKIRLGPPGAPRPRHQITESMEAEMVVKYSNGMSIDKIAADFGLYESTVRKRLMELGVHVPSIRLDAETIKRFGEQFDAGLSVRRIAAQQHVSVSSVSKHLEIMGKRMRPILKPSHLRPRRAQAAAMQNATIRRVS